MPPPSKAVQLANEFLLAPDPISATSIDQRALQELGQYQRPAYQEEKKRAGAVINDYDVRVFETACTRTGADLMALFNQPVTEQDIEKFTYRYWFNYFWSEGQSNFFQRANTQKSVDALKLFVKRRRHPIPNRLDFSEGDPTAICNLVMQYYELRGDITDTQKRELLTYFLKLGFVVGPRIAPVTVGDDTSIKGLAEQFYQYARGDSSTDKRQKIFWRGESRGVEQVLLQATKRLADIPFLADSMNMSKEWNPFFDYAISSFMWYRSGTNRDNDYYTVISVALNFATACCFPKINEKRVYSFTSVDPLTWKPGELEKFKSNIGILSSNGKNSLKLVVKTTVYLSAPSGPTLFTQSVQGEGAFPEYAVGSISHEEIFGYLVVYRAFDSVDEKSKFTVYIDRAASSIVRWNKKTKTLEKCASAGQNKSQFLPEIWNSLKTEYEQCLNLQPFETSWDGAGATQMVPKPTVKLAHPPPAPSGLVTTMLRQNIGQTRRGF